MVEIYDTAVTDIISNKCIDEKKNQIDIQWSKLMCDQVPTPGRRHVADGWSMVRSQRWLIGYTFLHQKSYVVPTLGQPYHINPTVGLLTLAQRGANVGMPTATFDQPCRPCTNVGSTSCCWLGLNLIKDVYIRPWLNLNTIKQRIHDQCLQTQNANICDSQKLNFFQSLQFDLIYIIINTSLF
jgi:hypothetical protein